MIVVVDQLIHLRRSSTWKLSHVELHRKALRISYLRFTTWWLNREDIDKKGAGYRTPPKQNDETKKKPSTEKTNPVTVLSASSLASAGASGGYPRDGTTHRSRTNKR